MSDAKTLTASLNYTKTESTDFGTKILLLQDHGGDYLGFSQDTNFPTPQGKLLNFLTLPDLKQSFKDSSTHFDILWFEACLMAGVEPAQYLKGGADYLVSSEEETYTGEWDYTSIFKYIGVNPTKEPKDISKSMVSIYMDGSNLYKYRTMSVIDLTYIDTFTSKFKQFSDELDKTQVNTYYKQVLSAVAASQSYGNLGGDSFEYSVDLKDFLANLKTQKVNLTSIDSLSSSIDNLVTYSRSDNTKPRSNGVSIFSLKNYLAFKTGAYPKEVAATDSWHDYATKFVAFTSNVTSKPIISNQKSCTVNNQDGICFSVSSSGGISSIFNTYLGRTAKLKATRPNAYLIVDKEPVIKVSEDNYFQPKWSASVFDICGDLSGNNCKGQHTLTEKFYINKLSTGESVYYGEGKVNGQDTIFYYILNSAGEKITDYWYTPYTLDSAGNPIFSKLQSKFVAGDKIEVGVHAVDLGNGQTGDSSLPVTITANWGFKNVPYDGSVDYFSSVIIKNLKGDSVNTDLIPYLP